MENHVTAKFGNRVRTRACGILTLGESILLVKHKGIGESEVLWAPPGGAVLFGESISEGLIREFQEETGLQIRVKDLINVNEFIKTPFHAIELFFRVEKMNGKLKTGIDPELKLDEQIITEVQFVTFDKLKIIPNKEKHSLLHNVKCAADVFNIPNFFVKN